VINLLIETDRVELLAGEPQPVDVPRDDGSTQTIFRCPVCQVAVFSQYTHPRVRFVRAGTLDDPAPARPDAHLYTRPNPGWAPIPGDVRALDDITTRRRCGPPRASSDSQRCAHARRRYGPAIDELIDTGREHAHWRDQLYDRVPEREGELFTTISGVEVDPL